MHGWRYSAFSTWSGATSRLLENIADSVIALRLISRQQLNALIEELYAFAAQPSTILSLPRIFQVRGTVRAAKAPTPSPPPADGATNPR
jgi:hypothetical protein